MAGTVRRGDPNEMKSFRSRLADNNQIPDITQQVVNSHVQRVVNIVEVEKINQVNRQVPTIQKIPNTVEVEQTQFTDKVVDVLVVTQRQVPMIQMVEKNVEILQVQGRIVDKAQIIPQERVTERIVQMVKRRSRRRFCSCHKTESRNESLNQWSMSLYHRSTDAATEAHGSGGGGSAGDQDVLVAMQRQVPPSSWCSRPRKRHRWTTSARISPRWTAEHACRMMTNPKMRCGWSKYLSSWK